MDLIKNGRQTNFFDSIVIDDKLSKYKKLLGLQSPEKEEGLGKNLVSIKEFIKSENSDKFNIKISKHLLNILKKSSPRTEIFMNSYINLSETDEISNIIFNSNNSHGTFKKVKRFLAKLFNSVIKTRTNYYELNVLKLFESIKLEVNKGAEFIDSVSQYIELINKAQTLHQTAQEEKLVNNLIIHVYESILYVNGFNKFITKEDLFNLQSKCSRSLSIDYIKNFIRVIPDSVVKIKLEADELLVFDNYCILYYDPSGKSYLKTEEEKEEEIKKDPILFGVISGSDKLYYISDWIDELCDLTLDQVVRKIGKVNYLTK